MKLTKAEADYERVTKTGESCHTCRYRIDQGEHPSTCKKVTGFVDPEHVCRLYRSR